MRVSLLLIFIVATHVSSCATIVSRQQLIAVDSNPRTLDIYDEDGYKLGRTPFVAKVPRALELKLLTEGQTYKADCSYRWIESGLGNAALLWGAIVGIPLDLATEAAYQCPTLNMIQAKNATHDTSSKFCRRYLILPPYNKSALLSVELEGLGRDLLQQHLHDCDTIVATDESDHIFTHYGIDHKNKKRDFDQIYYNYWMHATEANTLADFTMSDLSEKEIAISVKTQDMYDKTESSQMLMSSKENLRYYTRQAPYWVYWLEKFIPNTISGGIVELDPSFQAKNDYEITDTRRRGLGLFVEVMTLNNPSSLDTWATEYDWKVSYPFFYDKYKVKLKNTKTQEEFENQWTFFRLSANVQIEGTTHTPLGAYSLALGLAPTYLYTKTSDALIQNRLAIIPTISITFRAFFTHSMFFTLESFQQFEEKIDDDHTTRKDFAKISIGLGYLFSTPFHRYIVRK
jgi:hypothetical protein